MKKINYRFEKEFIIILFIDCTLYAIMYISYYKIIIIIKYLKLMNML